VRRIRLVTIVPLAGLLFFLLHGANGHLLDVNYSARPLAREIAQAAPGSEPVAELNVHRDLVYGLAFYRNQDIVDYSTDGIPAAQHILVFPTNQTQQVQGLLQGRLYQPLDIYAPQGLSVYQVYPRS
jgi:hypothetical protein